MATVPYNPSVNVAPTSAATPNVSVSTPIAAFGGTVANALEGLGKGVEHAGDEIFQRAVALQNLQNESERTEAVAKYEMEAGKLHANYSSLEGKAAVDGQKQYGKDLNALRLQIRDGMSNDMSRKMYDSQALSIQGRSIFNGAGHAATENKKWALGSVAAKEDASANYVHQNPTDDVGYEQAVRNIKSLKENVEGPIRGLDGDQLHANTSQAVSRLLLSRITGLSKTEPFKAQEMLENNRHQLYLGDVEKADAIVKNQLDTTGARIVTEQVTESLRHPENEDAPEKSLKEMEDEGEKRANEIDPKNEMLKERVRQGIIGKYNQVKQQRTNASRDNVQSVVGGILGLSSPDGQKPTNPDELIAVNPKISAAWDALKPTEKKRMLGYLANNAKGDYTETPESRAKYRELLGMRSTAPEEFIDQDVLGMHMPERQKTELYKMQLQTRVKAEDDPRVNRAMDTMRPILESLGTPITKKDDATRYNQFRGGMQLMIEDFVRDHGGKQPNTDEIRKIGNGLLQETEIKPGFWNTKSTTGLSWLGDHGTHNSVTLFERPALDEEIEAEKANPEYTRRGVPPPSNEEIRQELIRRAFNNLYSGKAKPKIKPTTGKNN